MRIILKQITTLEKYMPKFQSDYKIFVIKNEKVDFFFFGRNHLTPSRTMIRTMEVL